MTTDAVPYDPSLPCTATLRRVLSDVRDHTVAEDLLYLERWEMAPQPGAAAALRVSQIRRANPELAAAIRAELEQYRPAVSEA
jgi:hypothetical protein